MFYWLLPKTRVTRTTLIWLDKLKKDCIKNFPQGVSRDMRGRSCLTRKYSTVFVVFTHQNNRIERLIDPSILQPWNIKSEIDLLQKRESSYTR